MLLQPEATAGPAGAAAAPVGRLALGMLIPTPEKEEPTPPRETHGDVFPLRC